MEYALLLIAVTCAVSLGFGLLLEKYLKMPWMFAALFFGMIHSSFNVFELTLKDEPFQLFATLGMLFLLFMIGFNLRGRANQHTHACSSSSCSPFSCSVLHK